VNAWLLTMSIHPSLGPAGDSVPDDCWIGTPAQQLLSPDLANRTASVAKWPGIVVCLCGGGKFVPCAKCAPGTADETCEADGGNLESWKSTSWGAPGTTVTVRGEVTPTRTRYHRRIAIALQNFDQIPPSRWGGPLLSRAQTSSSHGALLLRTSGCFR